VVSLCVVIHAMRVELPIMHLSGFLQAACSDLKAWIGGLVINYVSRNSQCAPSQL